MGKENLSEIICKPLQFGFLKGTFFLSLAFSFFLTYNEKERRGMSWLFLRIRI